MQFPIQARRRQLHWTSPSGPLLGHNLLLTQLGPCQFGIQIHTPELAEIFLKFANTLRGFPVPSPAREVAILVVGAHTKAVYEQGAHRLISKLPQRDIEEINRGICPESFSREQRTAFQTATELMKPGPLAQSAWDEAFSVFGREGTMGIVHLVGFYKYVSTILNGFDAKWPQAQDGDE